MIIKSALIFLKVVDFVWDGFDKISNSIGKIGWNKSIKSAAVKATEPSYSVVRK